MREPLPHQLPYRADIDGLRALAVLAVVTFHLRAASLPGGFTGVDVFFVISGFLISSLILDAVERGDFSFAEFYARRIRRILPALITVLCAALVAGWFTLLPLDLVDLNKSILSGVLFVPNLQLWSEAGYFTRDANARPLLHLWSLGVEEQFYLFWPVVLIVSKRTLPWIIALVAGASFVLNVLFIDRYPEAVFYFPLTRLWELLGGAFLAWRERRHPASAPGAGFDLPVRLREMLSLSGSALLLFGDIFIKSSFAFPGWWALPPVIGTMLMIAAGPHATINRYVLSNPVVVSVGLISYPLYLWHWPVLVFWRTATGGKSPDVVLYLLAVVLLSWLTYRFIELPIRRRTSVFSRRAAVPALLGGGAVLALAGLAVIHLDGMPDRFSESLRPFLTYDYGARPAFDGECFLHPAATAGDWNESRCVEAQGDPKTPLLVLWGDSHAAQLRPGLEEVRHERKFRIAQMTAAGCPPYVDFDMSRRPPCRDENDLFVRKIAQLQPDIVVISADWVQYEELRLGPFRASIAALQQAGIRHIVVVGPVPHWYSALPGVLLHIAMQNQQRVPSNVDPELQAIMPEAALRKLVENAGATFVSAIEALCPANRCVTMTEYGPQYLTSFDGSHLTDPGSQLLVRRIADQLFAGVEIDRP
jgi:peptidoglycan/LPS O-acetylase OafA/YrhL